MTAKKTRLPQTKNAAPLLPQGSFGLRTRVFAYLDPRDRFVVKTEAYDFEFIRIENLNRIAGAEFEHIHPISKFAVTGSRGSGKSVFVNLLLIDHVLHDAEKATLSGLVMNDAPLVVGPRAADDFTWQLKAEANSRGHIFEVAESQSALEKLLQASIQAVQRRFARWLAESESATLGRVATDPLASLPGVLEVTHSLRSERGRLDAEKIRELFTLSRAELARITGIQEETIRQTPDSERLQRALQTFDRVARLLVLNSDRAKFATWLNSENDELDQRTPLEVIKEGRSEVVDTLVNDILTNRAR